VKSICTTCKHVSEESPVLLNLFHMHYGKCVLCNKPANDVVVRFPDCGCVVCLACWIDMCKQDSRYKYVRENGNFGIPCPTHTSDQPLNDRFLYRLSGEELYKNYKDLADVHYAFYNKIVYCPECSITIEPGQLTDFECSQCKYHIYLCVNCKQIHCICKTINGSN